MRSEHEFVMLGRKQLAYHEGIEMLRGIQVELARARAGADTWGFVAILANVTLIPLNVVVNAFELKAVGSLYQSLVRELYGKFAKSGTRADGHAKLALSVLKQAMVAELKRGSLAHYVPGVNIVVGLAEDSLAALQAVSAVEDGKREMAERAVALERKIAEATRQLVLIGIRRAELLDSPLVAVAKRTA